MLTSTEMVSPGSRFGVRLDALPETFLRCAEWCSVVGSLSTPGCIDAPRISGQLRELQGSCMPVLASLA